MAKFSFDWQETVYYNAVIEADTIEEAKQIFYSNDSGHPSVFDGPTETERDFEYVTHIEEIE